MCSDKLLVKLGWSWSLICDSQKCWASHIIQSHWHLNICVLSLNTYTDCLQAILLCSIWCFHNLKFVYSTFAVFMCVHVQACTHGLTDQLLLNLSDIWTSVHYCWWFCLGRCNRESKRESQKMTTAASITLSTSILPHFSTRGQMFGCVCVCVRGRLLLHLCVKLLPRCTLWRNF